MRRQTLRLLLPFPSAPSFSAPSVFSVVPMSLDFPTKSAIIPRKEDPVRGRDSALSLSGGRAIPRKKDEARELAVLCARAADDKKGERSTVLNLKGIGFVTDYFVITSGTNPLQIRAITDEIAKSAREAGFRRFSSEGTPNGHWVLLDYGDVVVHVFDTEARLFYDLEHLWSDAKRVRWQPPASKKTVAKKGDAS